MLYTPGLHPAGLSEELHSLGTRFARRMWPMTMIMVPFMVEGGYIVRGTEPVVTDGRQAAAMERWFPWSVLLSV